MTVLLPGIAAIIDRLYQKGSLFRRIKGKALPDWAAEVGNQSWGHYFLKYVVFSHPAVTRTIPATTSGELNHRAGCIYTRGSVYAFTRLLLANTRFFAVIA